ncbi:uncharacterized protein FA14DRAFT_155665 [Meira miltonrushii]|uniref:Uncharacterized protein n=1 Tax=Meira miltonrushii TaxID=1280837 RepID=A0A316VF57_9BASI|nr:uncharacterized protein FA14DRAFT_155665 [Meira miltonrushii]PWN36259.1 hypothetical protein FA14DRAFT_155665 [Meira miltonrushii]
MQSSHFLKAILLLKVSFWLQTRPIKAFENNEDSPNRSVKSPTHEFDWKSMIDWSYSPERKTEEIISGHSSLGTSSPAGGRSPRVNMRLKEQETLSLHDVTKGSQPVQPEKESRSPITAISSIKMQSPVQRPKRKYKNLKERYSAEKVKQFSRNYYINYRKDPERVKRVQENNRKRYYKRKAEKEEMLTTLTEAEKEAEVAKRNEQLAKRRFRYRLKKDPNAVNEPRKYKLSEKERRLARERGAKHRLKRMLEAQNGNSQIQ